MSNKVTIPFANYVDEESLLGPMNRNIKIIENCLKTKIVLTQDALICDNQVSEKVNNILKIISLYLQNHASLKERSLLSIIQMLDNYPYEEVYEFYSHIYPFTTTFDGRLVSAKTLNQKKYLEALDKNDIVFCIGAAGSGKTYLACAYALNLLRKNKIKKIIISRPVVEAGEKLGFLPGDLKEKLDPYLRPIYDALFDIIGSDAINKLMEKDVIEIAPLAYMRGRTMENAFIILDEAQNTTNNQMQMFLTRLGFNSKMVITGDITQIDLMENKTSGLVKALKMLKNIDNIEIIKFHGYDVMRHPLVSKIIEKYEAHKDDQN